MQILKNNNGNVEYIHNNTNPSRFFDGNDSTGLVRMYKVVCVDIDGVIDKKTSCDDKKDICPFGYGVRADGKI